MVECSPATCSIPGRCNLFLHLSKVCRLPIFPTKTRFIGQIQLFQIFFFKKRSIFSFRFTDPLQAWYTVLMGVIKPLLYKNAGPVLMVAIENEYGVSGNCDHNYTAWIRDTMWGLLGNDTVLYTSAIFMWKLAPISVKNFRVNTQNLNLHFDQQN